MPKILNVHDKYFRSSMKNLRVARDFLEAHLPKAIVTEINWKSLQVKSSQHINSHFRELMTDILYQVEFGQTKNYISILVEHQSTANKFMPFRVLHYIVEIMREELEKNPRKNLPLVIPLVFYSGKSAYRHSTDIFTLFGELEPLARQFFLKPFHLIDVGRIPDEKLKQHEWASLMELTQKHAHSKDFLEVFEDLVPLVKKLDEQGASGYIYETLQYICNSAKLDDPSKIVRLIDKKTSTQRGDDHMALTLMDLLHQKGMEKGIEQGIEQGMKKGMERGRREAEIATRRLMVDRMLAQGVGIEVISKVVELTEDELDLCS